MQTKKQADAVFRDAYDTYFEKIARFCGIKLKQRTEAQDCVQECFVVYYKAILRGEKIENTGAYLYKIADNLIKAQYRADKKTLNTVPIDELSEVLADDLKYDCSNFDFDLYAKKIISALDEKERNLYDLKYVHKLSIDEIAKELGISFEAAAKRLSRMRQKVKMIIKEKMEGDELN